MSDGGARRRGVEIALAGVVLGLAAWLRLVHLGTPSLWWDELVHVRMADRPHADVLAAVKWGAAPGVGNAGAMPVDYLALHAFLRLVPMPGPDHLETYLRAPACAWSILAVAGLLLVGRRVYGPAVGLLASLLLATAMPAILYAAEVRSYSLLTALSVASLGAFTGVGRAPRSVGRWLLFAAVSLLYVFTGILAVFVVATELAALLALSGRRQATAPRRLPVATIGLLLAATLGTYFSGLALDATYPRAGAVTVWGVVRDGLVFLAGGSPWLASAVVLAVPLATCAERRRGTWIVTPVLVGSFVVLPALAVLIQWKRYYFHGRHALLLLPYFHLLVAAGLLEGVRRVRALRGPGELAVAAALVVLLVGPSLRAFVAAPAPFFARSKTLRDTRAVAREATAAAATLAPGERYLLLAERDSTANAVLTAYLDWYGLRSRVALRSPGVPLDRVEPLLRQAHGDPRVLALRPAVGLFPALRTLLGIDGDFGDLPAPVTRFGLASYTQPLADPDTRRFVGVSVRGPIATAPSPPRS